MNIKTRLLIHKLARISLFGALLLGCPSILKASAPTHAATPMTREQAIQALTQNMDVYTRFRVINAVAQVPAERYTEEFVRTTQSLLTEDMDGYTRARVIAHLGTVPLEDYPILRPLVLGLTDAEQVSSTFIRFSTINPQEAYITAIRALLMSRWSEGQQIGSRRLEVLETDLGIPLNKAVEVLDHRYFRALYAGGVNIHSSDRDDRTNKALELLVSLWTPSEVEITQHSQSLIAHVRASGNHTALSVLMGGVEGVESLPGFGSLRQASGYLVNTRRVSVDEILAHFWHFIEHNVREVIPEDMDNARRSLISALENGVDTGSVVCDPGKIQRMATSVLQGRLQGVHIDTEVILDAGARVVRVSSDTLARVLGPERVANEEPIAANLPIRNLKEIEVYLNPLFQMWNTSVYPATAENLFRQTFEYWENLADGRIFGTEGRHIVLDPRDVVFYMMFVGQGVERFHKIQGALSFDNGTLGQMEDIDEGRNRFYKAMADNYIELYQAQETQASIAHVRAEEEE